MPVDRIFPSPSRGIQRGRSRSEGSPPQSTDGCSDNSVSSCGFQKPPSASTSSNSQGSSRSPSPSLSRSLPSPKSAESAPNSIDTLSIKISLAQKAVKTAEENLAQVKESFSPSIVLGASAVFGVSSIAVGACVKAGAIPVVTALSFIPFIGWAILGVCAFVGLAVIGIGVYKNRVYKKNLAVAQAKLSAAQNFLNKLNLFQYPKQIYKKIFEAKKEGFQEALLGKGSFAEIAKVQSDYILEVQKLYLNDKSSIEIKSIYLFYSFLLFVENVQEYYASNNEFRDWLIEELEIPKPAAEEIVACLFGSERLVDVHINKSNSSITVDGIHLSISEPIDDVKKNILLLTNESLQKIKSQVAQDILNAKDIINKFKEAEYVIPLEHFEDYIKNKDENNGDYLLEKFKEFSAKIIALQKKLKIDSETPDTFERNMYFLEYNKNDYDFIFSIFLRMSSVKIISHLLLQATDTLFMSVKQLRMGERMAHADFPNPENQKITMETYKAQRDEIICSQEYAEMWERLLGLKQRMTKEFCSRILLGNQGRAIHYLWAKLLSHREAFYQPKGDFAFNRKAMNDLVGACQNLLITISN